MVVATAKRVLPAPTMLLLFALSLLVTFEASAASASASAASVGTGTGNNVLVSSSSSSSSSSAAYRRGGGRRRSNAAASSAIETVNGTSSSFLRPLRRRFPVLLRVDDNNNASLSSLATKATATRRPYSSTSSSTCAAGGSSCSSAVVRGGAVVVVENTAANAVGGAIAMALIEKGVKEAFKAAGIQFPSQLGACIVLFAFLLATEAANPDLANTIFGALSPGSALLAKWLPVFFVPGLAMLPLAPPVGDATEVLKVLLVVVVGWVYTITTTTFSVLAIRQAQGTLVKTTTSAAAAVGTGRSRRSSSSAPKPFDDGTMDLLLKGTVLFGAASLAATKMDAAGDVVTPLRTAFLGCGTVAAYVWGARLPPSFTRLVHPLVTSCVVVLGLVKLFGAATGSTFLDVLRTYKAGSLSPAEAGAGDILLYLLGPSVVSFAVSMYSRRSLLRSNFLVVVVAMLVSSVGGLFGTAAFVRAICLGGSGDGGAMVRLSVLSRNVTTALAMALTSMVGGDISIAASVVVLTGILGATAGKSFLTSLGVVDPVCRGLGIGSSSQGLGVASISDEPDAFPFAAISMVLTAIAATTLVSIPSVKDALINLATGA